MSVRYYIGTSGWHYDHWRDKFYPKKLTNLTRSLKSVYIYFNNDSESIKHAKGCRQ